MAFEVLDVYHRGCLSYSQVYELLQEVYLSYPEFRGGGGGWLKFHRKIPTMNEMAVLVAALDVNGDNFIYEEQFMWILHLTQIVILEKVQGHYLESISPALLRMPLFHRIFNFIGSRKYCCGVDFILLVLASACLVNDESISSTSPLTDKIRLAIALFMFSDLVLQISVLGPFRYLTLKWSKFNLCLALAMAGASLYIKTSYHHHSSSSNQLESAHICSSIICIIRVFLFIRNLDYLFSSIQVSLFFATIKRIFKSLTSLLVSFACITYLFALTGVHLFGGLINKDPTRSQYETLQSTSYGTSNYYSLNFNTVPSGMITLICLLRVSGWDTFALAFEAVTHPTARIYFVLWYLIGVLFLMNIVATLFISGFIVEAATSSSSTQQQQQTKHETVPEENDHNHGMLLPITGGGGGTGAGNPLSESLLSSNERSEEKSSSLRQLANRLSQFMSPLSAAVTGANVRYTEHEQEVKQQHEHLSPAAGATYSPPTLPAAAPSPSSPTHPPATWNPDISRLTKGSSIREVTTAQEGGKFYMISMPKYANSGGNLSVDGGMVEEKEEEVNKKFMKRIQSLYSQDSLSG